MSVMLICENYIEKKKVNTIFSLFIEFDLEF